MALTKIQLLFFGVIQFLWFLNDSVFQELLNVRDRVKEIQEHLGLMDFHAAIDALNMRLGETLTRLIEESGVSRRDGYLFPQNSPVCGSGEECEQRPLDEEFPLPF